MEATRLIDPAFWAAEEPVAPGARLPEGVEDSCGLVWFRSSGSSGEPRWIGHTREGLLVSARVVNAWLGVDSESVWGLALPLKHVGGFGVLARAFEAGARAAVFGGSWEPRALPGWLDAERVSHLSLVPTQVHDLVAAGLRAPRCLRAVVVGGGALDAERGRAARRLGWPVLASYGMTEAGSQVATQPLSALEGEFQPQPIAVLPHWRLRTAEGGRLELSGPALFAATLERDGGGWRFVARRGEWHASDDRGELDGERLRFRGRLDRQVKVLGELVDPEAIERRLALEGVVVVALPDPRRGRRLIAVAEEAVDEAALAAAIAAHHGECEGYARVERTVRIAVLPRGPMGKVQRGEVAALLRERSI